MKKTIIYCNYDTLQVIGGDFNTGQIHINVLSLDYGTVVNGVALNIEALSSVLSKNKHLFKGNCYLFLDSSNIAIKKIEIPSLSKKESNLIVKNELSIGDNQDDIIYDANLYSFNDQKNLLGCAVDANLIKSYYDAFAMAKIKLHKIDLAFNAIAKSVHANKSFNNRTFLLNFISGAYMISLFFQNGNFAIANRNRILSSSQDETYCEDLYQNLSNFIQFNVGQKSGVEISASYYWGLSDEHLKLLNEVSMSRGLSVDILPYEDKYMSGYVDGMILPCVELIDHKLDINLLKAYNEYQKLSAKKLTADHLFIAVLLLSIGCIGGFTGFLYVQNKSLQKVSDQLNLELSEPTLVSQYAETVDYTTKTDDYTIKINALESIWAKTATEGVYSSDIIETIYSQAINGIEIRTVVYDSFSLKIEAISDKEDGAASYVEYLRKTGLFENISYSGWQKNNQSYELSLSLQIKAVH